MYLLLYTKPVSVLYNVCCVMASFSFYLSRFPSMLLMPYFESSPQGLCFQGQEKKESWDIMWAFGKSAESHSHLLRHRPPPPFSVSQRRGVEAGGQKSSDLHAHSEHVGMVKLSYI